MVRLLYDAMKVLTVPLGESLSNEPSTSLKEPLDIR